MLRASAEAEKIGVPSVSIIGSAFLKQAALVCDGMGLPLSVASYPGAPMVDSDATLREKVREHLFPQILRGLTSAPAFEAGEAVEPAPDEIVFRGTLQAVQEHFHRELWSDGMPIIPPTPARVAEFCRYTDRSPAEVIGILPQEGRAATIHNIAVNAIMAGCRPEYMPLLVALVEAMADPHFRLEGAGSTPAWEALVIVSGPIVKALDFNFGQGAMKVGRQANTTVGRFVRMYLRNACGFRIPPGAGDKGSIGYTFNVALAEDEDAAREAGWPTFAEQAGFASGESVVTVQSVTCVSPPIYSSGDTATHHAKQFADVLVRVFSYSSHSGVKRGYWYPLIVVSPAIAKVIAHEWTPDELKRYVWENMKMPASLMRYFCTHTAGLDLNLHRMVEEGSLPDYYDDATDPDRLVPIVVKPEHIGFVVAGDAGRNQSRGYMSNNAQGGRTSRRIELPRDWARLIAQAR